MITTVHDKQIVDDKTYGDHLNEVHDLPVDIIITPKKIINVRPKLAKPSCGILWDKISHSHLNSVAILKFLKEKHEKATVSSVS